MDLLNANLKLKDNSIILSRSIKEILEIFKTKVPLEFREKCDFIEDMTKDKQMQTLGLNHKYLPFALNRDYSLPLIFNGSQKRIREFSLFLKSLGLKLHEGGRVFNICDDCSKGFAMKSVVKKLRTELKSNPYTIVVGDSPNDISMLKQSDQPCIIPLPNKDNLIDLEIKNIIRAKKYAPKGWEEVIKSSGSFLVVELMRQGYDPAEACNEALKRVIKSHNGNPDFQICYIAMRKDGEVGAACLKWAFPHLITKSGRTKLESIKGIF